MMINIMALLAFNLTGAPLTLAAGNPSCPTIPASPSPPNPGPGFNVTAYLKGLSGAQYTALQVQVTAGSVQYNWTDVAEFAIGTLVAETAATAPVTSAELASGAVTEAMVRTAL